MTYVFTMSARKLLGKENLNLLQIKKEFEALAFMLGSGRECRLNVSGQNRAVREKKHFRMQCTCKRELDRIVKPRVPVLTGTT